MNSNKNQNIPKLLLILMPLFILLISPHLYAESQKEFNDTKISIILDPGHGGKDSGAGSITGLKEKDFNLYLAFALKNRLKNDFKVSLTRNSDYYSNLLSRANQANKDNSGIFISLHAGSLFSQAVSDNVLIGYCMGIDNNQNISTVDSIYKKYSEKSYKLAQAVRQAMDENNKKAILMGAPFMPLTSVDMPSVIIETGNLNSPGDAVYMKNPDHLEKLADIIAIGIKNYFRDSDR